MNFIYSFALQSNLAFTNVSSDSNKSALWKTMLDQCLQANTAIDKSRFTVNKLKRKIRNCMRLIKVFNDMIIEDHKAVCVVNTIDSQQDNGDCANCQILTEHVDDLQNQIEIKDIQLSELLDNVKKISVASKAGPSHRKDTSQSLVPEMCSTEHDLHEEAAMTRNKLLYKSASLNLKILDQLMKIVRDIPPFVENGNAFNNSEVFELHTDKFNLTNQQKNVCFKLWLPCHYSKRLKSPMVTDEHAIDTEHCTETDRLKQLIMFSTGEEIITYDILNSLQFSENQDIFMFLKKFELAYRMIFGDAQDQSPATMIKMFVKKFKFLDPNAFVLAAEKQSLEDSARFIDRIRRQTCEAHVQDGVQRIDICKVTSRDCEGEELTPIDGMFQMGETFCLERTGSGHMKYHRDSQTWEIEDENTISVESDLSCPDNSVTPIVTQINKLTVSRNGSSHMTCNAGEGLLASPSIERDLPSLPLEFVAPLELDETGRPHVQALLNGKKTKFLIDTGAELSVTRNKLPMKSNAPETQIVGFCGKSKSTARKISDVTFEIPGLVKTDIDIWFCPKAENLLGSDLINREKWVLDLGNMILFKDPSMKNSMVIDPSEYSNVGSMCTAIAETNVLDTGDSSELKHIVESFPCLWSKYANEIGTLQNTELNIQCRDPIQAEPQYNLPLESIEPISAIIQDFLQQGVLRKLRSVVNNRAWPIKRADNSYSLSVDFRTLNKLIPNNKPAVPENPDIMSRLDAKAKIFSVLEIANSHLSIPLAKSCQYKFAFNFQNEQYVFTRMPPGLEISDSTVHESVARILSEFSRKDCIFQHVDKLLLCTESKEQHIALLFELLTLLQDAGLKLHLEKVQLMRNQVTFLAMLISHGRRQLLQEKVRAISAVPIPNSHKALYDFLSEVNQCRDFIQGFAEKAKPLYDLLKNKDKVFGGMGQAQEKAFGTLKRDLQNAPTLRTIESCSSVPFVLQTNVSENAISTTLKDGNERIIGYFSRLLSPMEKSFESHVREILGVYFAVKATQSIVKTNKIILRTHDFLLQEFLEENGSGELRRKYSQWFRVLSSKQIHIDLTSRHVQQNAGAYDSPYMSGRSHVFRSCHG